MSDYIIDAVHWKVDIIGLEWVETPKIPVEAIREAAINSYGYRLYNNNYVFFANFYQWITRVAISWKNMTGFPDVEDSAFYVILRILNTKGYTEIYYGKESNGLQRKSSRAHCVHMS